MKDEKQNTDEADEPILPLSHEELTENFWNLYPTWDNSMRSMGSQCYRKLYWWLRGYSWKTSAKPIYFLFGSAWHEIKQQYYLSFKTHPDLDPITRALNAFKAGEIYWNKNESILDIETTPSPIDSIDNLRRLWLTFISYHGDEPPPFKIIDVPELGWLWQIEQDTSKTSLCLGGSIDAYINHRAFNTIALEEKSTSAYLTDKYMQQWEFSTQVTGYAWMLSQFKLQPKVLLQAAHKRVLGASAQTPQFASCLVEKTPEQLEDFENEWRNFFGSLARNLKNNFWSANGKTDPRQCVGGLGFSACPYRGLCASEQGYSADPLLFVGLGVREPWTPWKRTGKQNVLKSLEGE